MERITLMGGRERFSSKKRKKRGKERGNKFEMHILLCIGINDSIKKNEFINVGMFERLELN